MTAAMPGQRALVLIYDIRGFTAASKRLSTHDLGAFATGAHRAILDLFAAHPPTFVKHLGDGHLLLWETTNPPDPALLADVVAGAARARTAFAAYIAGREVAGAHLPRHVGVGVAFGEVSRADDYYGVALNLAARLQNLARPEGLALDRSVFEAAAAHDARLRTAFRRAKVRLKGLGSTIVWVDRPFSWSRLARAAAPVAVPLLVAATYVGLCDFDTPLPFGDRVRWALDSVGRSIGRPVHDDAAVADAMRRVRVDLVDRLLAVQTRGDFFPTGFTPGDDPEFDVWSSSQAVTALLRAPELTTDRARRCVAGLRAAFAPARFIERDGVVHGWLRQQGSTYTEAEPCLWTNAALALALGRPGVVPDAERPELLALLGRAQAAALTFRPLETGAWNIFPRQKQPDRHSPYSTSLALLMLLEARAAGLPFAGSVARRDEVLAQTVAFVGGSFLPDGAVPGWRRTADPNDTVSPGLTFQNFALLLRAERDAGLPLPPAIAAALPEALERLARASMNQPPDAGEFAAEFVDHEGRADRKTEMINLLWYPWAVYACRGWLERDARLPGPAAHRFRVRRALGHLVVDHGGDAFAEATKGYIFVASETLFAFSDDPRPR
jgi:class 3 adenylate cyclase